MSVFHIVVSCCLVAAALAYDINGSPTLPPINWEYQVESFVTYLAVEQEGYPSTRQDMTTTAALQCMTDRIVTLLPGVQSEDVFWNTSAISATYGIWDHQETVFYEFNVNFVPQNIIFYGMPNYNKQYDGATPINWKITNPNKVNDDGVNKGWNGIYSQNVNCRDCFPSTDVVYLRFKDLIAQDVTSGKFLTHLQDGDDDSDCATIFATTNYAYVSFSESAAVTEGSLPKRRHHDKQLNYVWFLLFLLVPATIFLYNKVYNKGVSSYFLANYNEDREAEMVAAIGESNAPHSDEDQA
jgi:hypothetical protein